MLPPPRHVSPLARLLGALVAAVLPASALAAVPAPPAGGCPPPLHTLVVTELMTGPATAPRWVEVRNPGKATVSLLNVQLAVKPAAGTLPAQVWPLGGLVAELPGGESLAFGHVPVSKVGDNAWLKLEVLDLGSGFLLPPCAAKVVVEGPYGLVDAVSYKLCSNPDDAKPTVLALEPSLGDGCKNDDPAAWCQSLATESSFGTPGKDNPPCDLDGDGYSSAAGDCDDLKKAVFPGATEVCNGADDDCNGLTDEYLVAPPGTCLSEGVCAGPLKDGTPVAKCEGASGFACTYPFGYESVTETLCDGFDNDCDGLTDENLLNACGACGAPAAETCNGKDDDCDGVTDEDAQLVGLDCPTLGVCVAAQPACVGGEPICGLPDTWEAVETRCDGADNDCDGETDEDLGLGASCTAGTGACAAAGVLQCGSGGATTCSAPPRAPSAELCGDGLDNNCDGSTDEGFAVGAQCAAGTGACRVVGKKVCSADRKSVVCNVKPAPAVEAEQCGNALDDDCDGQTDESSCEVPGAGAGCRAEPASPAPWGLAVLAVLGLGLLRRRRV